MQKGTQRSWRAVYNVTLCGCGLARRRTPWRCQPCRWIPPVQREMLKYISVEDAQSSLDVLLILNPLALP